MKNDYNSNPVSESYNVREYKKKNNKNGQKSIQLPSSTIFKENDSVIVISEKEFNNMLTDLQELKNNNESLRTEKEKHNKTLEKYNKLKTELEILENREMEYKQLINTNQLLEKDIEILTEKLELLKDLSNNNENTITEMSIKIKESAKQLQQTNNNLELEKKNSTDKTLAINYYQGYINALLNRGLYSRIINKEPVNKFNKPKYVLDLEKNKK